MLTLALGKTKTKKIGIVFFAEFMACPNFEELNWSEAETNQYKETCANSNSYYTAPPFKDSEDADRMFCCDPETNAPLNGFTSVLIFVLKLIFSWLFGQNRKAVVLVNIC